MVVFIGWQQRGDQTWQHHIRYPIRIRSEIALTDLGGQHVSETMSCSSHHHHDLAHSFCRATLDDVHQFRFRHRRATETSTRMVRMRHQQVLQSRTHSPSECTSLAEPQAHTQSGQCAIGGNICGRFSCGGGDVEPALWESMTTRDSDIFTQRRLRLRS